MLEISDDKWEKANSPVPVTERPMEHLFYFGGKDHEALLSELLRKLNSLLRVTMAATCDDEKGGFLVDSEDLVEILFMIAGIAEDAENEAKILSNLNYEARAELENRVSKMSNVGKVLN